MAENVSLKISSAVIIGGKMIKSGEVVEVTNAEARDLLHRGKANLATSKPAVAIHYTDEVHVPEAPAVVETDEPTAEEAPVKPKRIKKAK